MPYAQARSRFLVTQQVRHAMHPVFPMTMRPPHQQVQRAHQGIFVQQQQQPLLAPQYVNSFFVVRPIASAFALPPAPRR